MEEVWDDERKKEQLHWMLLFSNLIAQWAQWIGLWYYQCGFLVIDM